MIKGVNKHIVEINNPNNDYFEKAILYVRPDKLAIPPKELSGEARSYLDSLGFQKRGLPWAKISIALTACAGIVISAAALIIHYL